MDKPVSKTESVAGKVQLFEENCVSPIMAEIFRQKSPAERLEIAFRMWTGAREMVHSAVSQQHADWSVEAVNREVARRMSHGRV